MPLHLHRPFVLSLSAAVAVVLSLAAGPASAQRGPIHVHGWGGGGWHHPGWHGGGWHRAGWGHGGNSFSFGLGLNLTPGYWGAPAYYYPPPRYYPPVVYAPPYAAQPLVVSPSSPIYMAPSGRYCREFQSTGRIDGRVTPLVGTACLDPDGSWRVVR